MALLDVLPGVFNFFQGARISTRPRRNRIVLETLAPGEKRSEGFSFPIPAGSQTQVKATIMYFTRRWRVRKTNSESLS